MAGLLSIVLPGLGHALTGRVERGIFAGVGVLGLLLGGLLIGGVDAIDSREDRAWFLGQAFGGPIVFAVDAYHQSTKAYPVQGGRAEELGLSRRTSSSGPDYSVSENELDTRIIKRRIGPDETREVVDVIVFDAISGQGETRQLPVAVPQGSFEAGAPPIGEGLGKLNEIAMLYILCAGLLNIIVFFDAAVPTVRDVGSGAGQVAEPDENEQTEDAS